MLIKNSLLSPVSGNLQPQNVDSCLQLSCIVCLTTTRRHHVHSREMNPYLHWLLVSELTEASFLLLIIALIVLVLLPYKHI